MLGFVTVQYYNDCAVCKQSLEFISLMCESMKLDKTVFFTACRYFMTCVRSNGTKYIDFYFKDSKTREKSFVLNLCLNCINFASKVCLEKSIDPAELINVYINEFRDTHLFPEIIIENKEVKRIEENLKTSHVLSPYVWDFVFIKEDPTSKLNYKDPNFFFY